MKIPFSNCHFKMCIQVLTKIALFSNYHRNHFWLSCVLSQHLFSVTVDSLSMSTTQDDQSSLVHSLATLLRNNGTVLFILFPLIVICILTIYSRSQRFHLFVILRWHCPGRLKNSNSSGDLHTASDTSLWTILDPSHTSVWLSGFAITSSRYHLSAPVAVSLWHATENHLTQGMGLISFQEHFLTNQKGKTLQIRKYDLYI